MAQPHPSLLLVLDIDESFATQETRLEVSRCYGYVGSTVVRPHATPEDGRISNTMEMRVKLNGVKYLRERTADADELWDRIMERWLFNQFHTVGNQMQIYNRRQREEGNLELYFDWLDVVFEEGDFTVRIKLNSVSSLPAECAKTVTAIRRALNDGSIGADVDRVYLPAPDSFIAQARAWEEAEPEREAARLEAEANFSEAPDLAEPGQEAADGESWQEELERKYSLPAPDFDIDYSIWGIVQPDGVITAFDSDTNSYVDESEVKQSFAIAEMS